MSTAILFQTMPPLSVDEYANLEQSIRDHGIQVPIIVDEDGVVIDGHHRQKIAESLGVDCPVDVKYGMTDVEKRSLSVSLNIDRRQLSREQRRAIIAESLRADPELSNREHGRRVGVDDKTVGAVRRELESTAEIPQSDVRVSADGRERPATQPERPVTKMTDTHKEETYWDASTGEQIERAPSVKPRRAPKPVPTGDAAAQVNREEGVKNFSDALFNFWQMTFPSHREWLIADAWPGANDTLPPDDRERATPATFRAIAEALNQLADEWENTND